MLACCCGCSPFKSCRFSWSGQSQEDHRVAPQTLVFFRQCPIEPIARTPLQSPSAVDPRSSDRLPVLGSRDAPVRRRAAPDLVAPVLSILAKRFDKQIVFPWVRARQEKGWKNAARGFANTVAPLLGASIAALNWRFAYVLMSFGYVLIGGFRNLPAVMAGLVLSDLGFGLNGTNSRAWLLSRMPTGARGRALGGLIHSRRRR